MAVTNFIREVWSSTLLTSLKDNLVFAGPGVANRNYEGEIADSGDTVKITSISRPTVADYTAATVIAPEQLTDASRSLLINQAKFFAFEVDDVDLRQSVNGGALMAEAAMESAYALADVADAYVAGLYTGVDAANAIGTVSVTTPALALTGLVNLKTKLDNANVPTQGRYVIVPPWYHGLLLQNTSFIDLSASGSADALRNGTVGRAFGFDIMVSNSVINSAGDDWIVQAGYPGAIAFAEQIAKVVAYKPENSFSDAIKGLHLYGAKLIRPTGIATMAASIT